MCSSPLARGAIEANRDAYRENALTLEIPDRLTLLDGTTVDVRAVCATVTEGQIDRVIYTVEKASGAWVDVAADAMGTLTAVTTASP